MLSNWQELTAYLKQNFSIKGDMLSVLFLVGLHETGNGFRQYTQDEKTDLVKLAKYTLLARAGFFRKVVVQGRDPLFIPKSSHPLPAEPGKLDMILKNELIKYFNQNLAGS